MAGALAAPTTAVTSRLTDGVSAYSSSTMLRSGCEFCWME